MTFPSDFLRWISAIACLSSSRLVLRLGVPSEAPCQRPGVISSSGSSAANLCIGCVYQEGGLSGSQDQAEQAQGVSPKIF